MNKISSGLHHRFAAFCCVLVFAPWASAAGLLTPAQGQLPQLEIKEHHVEVIIEDGYAITTVNQQFYNPHNEALEAIYAFPVPEKASVGEFTYWIDGSPVTAEVVEKKRATEIYEKEKSEGREVAVTEQDDYRTFDSRVYPVMPRSDVQIRLVYIQPVHVDLGIGRYVYPLEEGGVDEAKLAFWRYNDSVQEKFSFNLQVRSSYPIDSFRLPAHPQASITQSSSQLWSATIGDSSAYTAEEKESAAAAQSAPNRLDKDIVVYWRHEQGLPGAIDMVSYKPENSSRGTFMMTVTPGDDLSTIQTGRDWVFVLDLSGSMQGKYHSLVEGVEKGLQKLDPQDRFRIVLFNNSARELTKGYIPVSSATISNYMQQLENISPDGGTNLYAGLEKGIKGLDSDRPSAILLVTDGVANVGKTEKRQFLKLLEACDVRLYSFVMGNSANRPLLEGMTKVSNGFAMNISNSDDIVGKIAQTADKLNHEAYRDIDIKVKGVKVKDVTPAQIGSLYRGQQLIVFGHYWGSGLADVEIRGKVSSEDKVYRTQFEFPEVAERNPEIERLWAFANIEDLQNRIDYFEGDTDSEQAIVDLAIEYGLVTNYTSMIAMREEMYQQYGIDRNNLNRVQTEAAARAQRASGQVQHNRADSAQPAFSGNRAYPSGGSGGGAAGPWMLLFITLLMAMRRNVRSHKPGK